MALNNVRPVGDDRPWKDEVEREFRKIWDALKFGKITLRAATTSALSGGGGTSGPGITSITATLPATYDTLTYDIGIDQDAFSHISNLDYAQFDTTAGLSSTSPGMLTWNDTDGTLEFQLKGGLVTLQIGQEQVLRVRNDTGSTLTEGTVVYITGSDGTNFNVAPALADADATSAQTLGVLTETLNTSSTQHGYVTTNGLVRGIDLSYISGLTAGDILFLDGTTAGRMTNVKPSAPIHMVYVGYCLSANGGGTNSTVFIKPQNGYELDEIHDVKITGPIANNEILAYTSSTSLWENKTAAEAGIASTTNPTISTGTFNSPTINTGNLNNPLLTRIDSASEGGQINFARSSDNAQYWYVDSYGSTSTPDLRFIAGSTNIFQLSADGSTAFSGSKGSSGQVLQSQGANLPPVWATVAGASSNSFTTMNAPAGTDPVALTSTDTLNFANGSNISITGDSSTKTLTFAVPASPAFTGTPTAPTAGAGTSTTQIATTAFVQNSFKYTKRGYTLPIGGTWESITHAMAGSASGNNLAGVVNRMFFHPFKVESYMTLTGVSLAITTAASGTWRLGIYGDDEAGGPGALIVDAGTISTSTNGTKTINTGDILLNVGCYWFVTWQGTTAVGTSSYEPTNGANYITDKTLFGASGNIGYSTDTVTYGTAFPSDWSGFGTITKTERNKLPRLRFKT